MKKWTVDFLNAAVAAEMTAQPRDIARAIYVTAIRRRVVILRVFTKRTEKTPRGEIKLALRRSREVT
ncbi:MAG: type II toxin-antitoxin system RelE/ParE family toxin [Pseudaminobacter sp.]|nr:type II toxin-antitoxin system RelE/ParE family toxin [Pseudaminobacter sp.]